MCEKDVYTTTFLKGDSEKRGALFRGWNSVSFEVGLTNENKVREKMWTVFDTWR